MQASNSSKQCLIFIQYINLSQDFTSWFCFFSLGYQWFYLAIFKALYESHSQSKNDLYFPNFMYFSTYFPNFHKIFSQIWRKR